jgi:hypothetical protein
LLRQKAEQEPCQKPRSSHSVEAETLLRGPPIAQERSRTRLVLVYFALFARPVRTMSNTFIWPWQPLIFVTKHIIIIVTSGNSNNFFAGFEQFLPEIGPEKRISLTRKPLQEPNVRKKRLSSLLEDHFHA